MDDTTGQVVGLISTFLLFGGLAQRTCLRGQRTCFGVINSLSSLGSVYVSCYHCFLVVGACLLLLLYGFVTKQDSLILSLSKSI